MSPCISRCLLENRFVQPLLFSRPLLLAMGVANSVSHSSQKCDLLFSQWILPIFDYLRDWLCVFKFQMRDVLLVWALNFCCQAVGESHNSRELNLCEQVAGRWRSVEAGSHTRTTGPGPSVVVYSVIGHGWFVPEPWAVIKDHTWQEVKQVGNDYMLVIMFDQWNHGLSSVVQQSWLDGRYNWFASDLDQWPLWKHFHLLVGFKRQGLHSPCSWIWDL